MCSPSSVASRSNGTSVQVVTASCLPSNPPRRTPWSIAYCLEAFSYFGEVCTPRIVLLLFPATDNSSFTFERSASYVDFSARRTASPVLPYALAALPALWTKDETLEGSFHCTTISMSGMLQPCVRTSV